MDAEYIFSLRAANLLLISTEYSCCNSAEVGRLEKSKIELFDYFVDVLS